MNDELAQACHMLRKLAYMAPPGERRDHMLNDLINLRDRLDAMPGRVAALGAMKDRETIRQIIAAEIRFAFADVLHWAEP